jgi:hypothetical protein
MEKPSQRRGPDRARLPLVVLLLPLQLGAVADVDEKHAAVLGIEAAPCPVRWLAGEHACPGCGLSRSTALAVQGQFLRSFHVHPAGVVVAALCALGLPIRLAARFGRIGPKMQVSLLRHGHKIFVLGILGAWLVRLIR